MESVQLLYISLLALVFILPLIISFNKKINFHLHFKYAFPAIIITALVFLVWDIRFTESAIWQFNPQYLTNYFLKGLPIEEWFFFIAVPFASLFIYHIVSKLQLQLPKDNFFAALSLVLIVLFAAASYFSRGQLYPFFTFLFLAVYLAYTIFRNRFKQHLAAFYLSYLLGLIPFLLINSFYTALPVIKYDPDYIWGIRLFTIPLENFGYYFLLLLMNATIYETLQEGKYY